jgi:predicted PurR-regulated permease PerM
MSFTQQKKQELTDDEEKVLANIARLNELMEKKIIEESLKNKKANQKILEQSERILNKVKNKTRSYRRLFDVVAVFMLILALILLYWDDLRIYFIYLLRLLIVAVSKLQRHNIILFFNCKLIF